MAHTNCSGNFRTHKIDSLDGFTFQNQLMYVMLVIATQEHLHPIISFLAYNKYAEMLKVDNAFF